VVAEHSNEVEYAEDDKGVYILSNEFMSREENAEWANSVLRRSYISNSGEGALDNARREALDADAEQLVLLIQDNETSMTGTAAVLGSFFAFGFGYGALSFKKRL